MIRFVKLTVLTFTVFLFAFMICGRSSADTTITPREYMRYLTEKGKIDHEALEVRDQFRNLSEGNKKKFIYYMSNPKIMKDILQTEVPENSTKVLYGGDIVITRKTQTAILDVSENVKEEKSLFDKITSILVTPVYAAGKIYHMRVDDTQVEEVLNIKSRTFKAWVVYNSDRKTVTAIQDGNGTAKSHWPTNAFVKDSVSKYIYGNKAHCCLVWYFGMNVINKFIDSSAISVEYHHHVLGNAIGGKSYRLYRG